MLATERTTLTFTNTARDIQEFLTRNPDRPRNLAKSVTVK